MTIHSPRRVVVTEQPDKEAVILSVYEGAERLTVVQLDAHQAVAVAGDLIEAARLMMERQR